MWPQSADELIEAQDALAAASPPRWVIGAVSTRALAVGACAVYFPRGQAGPGAAGDAAWAAAAVVRGERLVDRAVVRSAAGAPYRAGLLALREGPALSAAVGALSGRPDVLLADATGRDHPRRAGMALHLGAVLDVPTVGVTHRPLLAGGHWPDDERGASSPLTLAGEVVGVWLRTRPGTRPLAVHAGWRTSVEDAAELVLSLTGRYRTPAPFRIARQEARVARARAAGLARDG
jgi:deoxyribonuclease V